MRIKNFVLIFGLVSFVTVTPVCAKDKEPKAKPAKQLPEASATVAVKADASVTSKVKEPWLGVKVVIAPTEREVIQEYAVAKHRTKKLPPGLAKKVARGKPLPPGWQKKVVVGQQMPEDVFKACHRLPAEVVVKLPPPPKGTILVAVHGKVVRLLEATREILDVFDVRL